MMAAKRVLMFEMSVQCRKFLNMRKAFKCRIELRYVSNGKAVFLNRKCFIGGFLRIRKRTFGFRKTWGIS